LPLDKSLSRSDAALLVGFFLYQLVVRRDYYGRLKQQYSTYRVNNRYQGYSIYWSDTLAEDYPFDSRAHFHLRNKEIGLVSRRLKQVSVQIVIATGPKHEREWRYEAKAISRPNQYLPQALHSGRRLLPIVSPNKCLLGLVLSTCTI
jgi:hypothetical protein